MSEWKEYKLADIIDEISMGPFGSNIKVDCFVGQGVPVLNGSNLIGFKLCEKSFNYVTKEKADSLGHSNAYRGDVIVTHRGTLGQIVYIPTDSKYERYVISQSQFRFACNKDIIDAAFLVFYFHSREGQYKLLSNASQVGVPALARPTSTFKELYIKLPCIEEQKQISGVLSSLDDKIDLLHRENATLEALAETLFRHYFIENPDPTWKEGKLGDEFNFTMGQSPSGDSFNEDGIGIPMYQGNADFGFRFPTRRVYTTAPTRFAEENDTLISVRAPVGAQNMASEKCCIGRGVAAFRHKDKSLYSYTYYKLKSLLEDIRQFNDNGTVFGSISKSDFENIDIVIPNRDRIVAFQKQALPIDEKIRTNYKQILVLSAQRDSLLPRLMSGETKVTGQ